MNKLRFQTILTAAALSCGPTLWAQTTGTTDIPVGNLTVSAFPSVTTLGEHTHLLPVSLPGGVDTTSLDGRDVWVVSLKGFNQLAKFVRFERSTIATPVAADTPTAGVALVPVPTSVPIRAFYEVSAPAGGWVEGDELFTVLLQPNEVRLVPVYPSGVDPALVKIAPSYLPPVRLGDFRVALPPPPPPPINPTAQVSVYPDSTGAYAAKVMVNLPGTLDIADWGKATRVGDVFTIASTTGPAAPTANVVALPPVRVVTKSFPLDLTETPVVVPVADPVVAANTATAVEPVPFQVVQAPARSVPGTIIVQSLTQWNALWSTTSTGAVIGAVNTALPVAPVNFDKNTLLGIFTGSRNSGGYGIVVDSVTVSAGVVTVTWHETVPAPGTPVTLAITQPSLWLSLAKETRPIRFVIKPIVTPPPVVIPPVVVKVYTVNFTLDGKKLASTSFVKQPATPPPPPVPFPAVKVQAAVTDTTARVTVTFATAADAARIGSWGVVETRDRILVARAVSRSTTEPALAVLPPLTHTYEIPNLTAGAWQFLFTVDGYVAGQTGWVVGTVPPPVVNAVSTPVDQTNDAPKPALETGFFVLDFARDPAAASTYVVEVTTDLITWMALTPDQFTSETQVMSDGREHIVIKVPDAEATPRRYARLRVLTP